MARMSEARPPRALVARVRPVERWLHRVLLPVITLTGAAIVIGTWKLAPGGVIALGVAVTALGLWLQLLSERLGRESMLLATDGSVRISCPGLLTRELRIPATDIEAIFTVDVDQSTHGRLASLTLLSRGEYTAITFVNAKVIEHARWTNVVWCLRAESDHLFVPPPLPRRAAQGLLFAGVPSSDG